MASSITEALRQHAQETPTQPAIIAGAESFTYAELWAHTQSAADWFAQHGVRPADRVVIPVVHGDAWFVVAYFGVHLAGATAVPLDTKAAQETAVSVQRQVAPAFVLDAAMFDDLKAFVQEAADDPGPHMLPPVSANDIADILFTSGSTGEPKGVVLTHGNIIAATDNIIAFIGNDASDREVVTVPLNHSFGLGRLRCNVVAGGTLILVPGLSFPSLVFNAIATHSATGLACVPSGLAVLMRAAGEQFSELTRGLRYMELGSERMEPVAKRELMRLLPQARICMHYGLTEASRSTFTEFHADAERLDSVGRPAANVSLKVCDVAGTELATLETGRICLQAPTVMKAYWRDPDRTREAFDEQGWFDTGDLGFLDEAGYLFLQGRSDDVINVGGKKIHPSAIEDAAVQYSGVAEAACVAGADPEGLVAEVPVLYIVQTEGAQVDAAGLLQFLATSLEPYAVPRTVRVIDALPRTDSGKLRRSVLKAQEKI